MKAFYIPSFTKWETVKSKYRNKTTVYDGIGFDSMKERDYYLILKNDPTIRNIVLQPKYELQPTFKKNGKTIQKITYIADFEVHYYDNTIKVIDVKGFQTKDFKIKRKMFEYKYPHLTLDIV